ncbi:MAG: rhomboid family intramembrane serine protease [Bacteroidales bacterium]|nr:rhomboid family intramembrane serine protease [Bacteroidales bacterium]
MKTLIDTSIPNEIDKNPKGHIAYSILVPLIFIALCWCVKLIELSLNTSFYYLGIYPQQIKGLYGILFAPFIHENLKHLINNSIPFLLFAWGVFYFYRSIAMKILLWVWLMTGLWVWVGARPAYHIGASGIVYGLAFFLFFSGAIRKTPALAAVSLIVVFLYGSMIWGIFPFIPDVSWESHLSGGLAGLILAFLYRKEGPQPPQYEWENELDEEDINEMLDEYLEKKKTFNLTRKDEAPS